MPQGPIPVKNVAPSYGLTDVHATAVIKSTPGVLATVIVVAPGTGGALTFNNCATTGAAATANEIITIAYGSLSVGQVITLNFPCNVGIVLSAVTSGGGIFSITYS
jgi:hypothetical protein